MGFKIGFRVLVLLFGCGLLAQKPVGKIPLRKYLKQLETTHKVHFGFIDEDISGVSLVPKSDGDLKEKVAEIEKATNLVCEFVSEDYVVIRKESAELVFCVTVIDSETKMPLPFASVTSGKMSAQTDENGKFCANTIAVFTISFIGYETREFQMQGQKTPPIIALDMKREILEEVTISHLLTRGIRQLKNGSFNIQSKSTGLLPGLTEPDVFQTMQQLPGAVSFDETISNLSIRGGTHDQNLFFWNGIRLFQTGHFFGLVSALNPNLSHSITVYKNATPAQYGDAVSGTVLIETLPETGSYYENSIGVNMLNFDFNTAFKTSDKTSFQFSGRRSTTDFYNTPTYNSYSKRIFQNTKVTNLFLDEQVDYRSGEKFYFYDFTGQFRQKFGERSELQVNAIFIENELELYQSLSSDTIRNDESELKQQSLAANAVFRTDWNARHHSSLSVFGTRYRVDSDDRSIGNNGRNLRQENVIVEKGLTARHTFRASENLIFKSGYHLSETSVVDHNADNLGMKEEESRFLLAHTLFLQAEFQWRKWFFFGGIRQNYFQTLDRFRTEPRIVTTFDVNKNLQFSLQGELKSQSVQQTVDLQQDFFGLEKKRWTVADNLETPLITSTQTSFLVSYKKNRWLLSAEPFYKKVRHITSRSQGFQNQFEFADAVGEYRVYGIEFLAQKQWTNVTAWLNYQFNRNQYHFDSFTPTEFPNIYSIPNALRFGAVYDDLKWQFALGANWLSGKYYTGTTSPIPIFDANQNLAIAYAKPNARQLDDYLQTNFSGSFSRQLSSKIKVKIGASVQNIFDRTTEINRSYRINQVDATIQQVNISSLGRTFSAFLRVFF
ncbi:TonB-dependent receptor plug domain-containing protein [Flavobacterium sp.]|uniref:TonB-dependent receptor n=1 Tax=Flavobacterium sp. TaxID=239 RepID=UPI00121318A4|nr:TonB-dependent receptor plug domain-containing protein [Flavobacterium sp.]RZJ71470.1 MAG: hypothetical protein EOO49_10450 [Flavobacterium sp.]